MLINNIDIKNFNSQILEVDIQNSKIISKENINTINRLFPTFFKNEVGLNAITVTLLVNSLDKKKYFIDKSNLLKEMLKPFYLYFKDRDLKFYCVLIDQMNKASLKQIRGKLQLQIIGYNVESVKTLNLNRISEKNFYVGGNYNIPAVIEITPSIDLIDLVINGLANDHIIIKNLHANKKIIINGKEGTVLEEGKNKFEDTDFWEFPFLVPGPNTITLSKNSCDVVIKYEPRYL
ncbi:phage distal tail protein [Clostridium perfringens]|uniref:phage distal tail protein n=1 Tax=Clostridium perfringens TaxID=1502 RepID=UPI0018E495B6|nr:phage tail family protein [Clostridium perfringens]MBI6033756.1 phage tail family protein [Clostridium perfringens]MDU3664018.1 phage tail family protein [Clostridium perfringens]